MFHLLTCQTVWFSFWIGTNRISVSWETTYVCLQHYNSFLYNTIKLCGHWVYLLARAIAMIGFSLSLNINKNPNHLTWTVLYVRAYFKYLIAPFHHQKSKKNMALSFTKTRGFKIFFASLQNFMPILLGEGEPDSLESLRLLSPYCLKLLLLNTAVFLTVYHLIYTRNPKELYKTTSIHFKYLGGNSDCYLKQKAVFANG